MVTGIVPVPVAGSEACELTPVQGKASLGNLPFQSYYWALNSVRPQPSKLFPRAALLLTG